MEAAMEIRRHLHNETSRAIGGFLGFAQCLLRPNVVTAVGNVFLIRLASLVLVDVPAMKCPRCEGSIRLVESLQDVDIEDALERFGGRPKVVVSSPLQLSQPPTGQRNASHEMLRILTRD